MTRDRGAEGINRSGSLSTRSRSKRRIRSYGTAVCFLHLASALSVAEPALVRLAVSEGKEIRFAHLTSKDGLSPGQIRGILQDNQGFLWVNTTGVLNRYDGYQFRSYSRDPAHTNYPAGGFIHTIFKDRSGFLWVSSNESLDRFDPTTEATTRFPIDRNGPHSVLGPVTQVSQDRAGIVWLSTATGLHRLDPASGAFRHYAHDPDSLSSSVVKWCGVATDIEDRKRAEQLQAELAHSNRVSVMGELAASIAHEVNQPLSGIVSNASASLRWLAREVPDLEEAREGLHRIVCDGKRAGEVVDRIRSLTKRAELPRERLDLNEIIREVLALVGDEAKRQRVVIRTQFADDLSPISGDRVQLQQVVLNLVVNGIEAMNTVDGRARELVITTRNIDPDQVQVTVEDSGVGLKPNTIEKIFDPFYTTKPGGMGMGLSISRSILEKHGGRLWATANHGPGTSFHFTLPKYPEKGSHAGAARV